MAGKKSLKQTYHINAVMNELSRRDFLKMLGVTAGAAATNLTFGPRFGINMDATTLEVPPTLMLHSKDRWKLVTILKYLTNNGYHSLNYQDLGKIIRGDSTFPEKPIILSIDDVSSRYIFKEFIEMIDLIEKASYTGVLGIVTQGKPADHPDVWATLKEIAARGWEMDTHTTHHALLPALKDIEDLRSEVIDSAKMIQDGLGIYPTTLIVPYANIRNKLGAIDRRIFSVSAEGNLDFVVGMAQGREVTPGQPPYFVGRVGTGVDSTQTAWWITHFNASVGSSTTVTPKPSE